jgi:hypothetical protein
MQSESEAHDEQVGAPWLVPLPVADPVAVPLLPVLVPVPLVPLLVPLPELSVPRLLALAPALPVPLPKDVGAPHEKLAIADAQLAETPASATPVQAVWLVLGTEAQHSASSVHAVSSGAAAELVHPSAVRRASDRAASPTSTVRFIRPWCPGVPFRTSRPSGVRGGVTSDRVGASPEGHLSLSPASAGQSSLRQHAGVALRRPPLVQESVRRSPGPGAGEPPDLDGAHLSLRAERPHGVRQGARHFARLYSFNGREAGLAPRAGGSSAVVIARDTSPTAIAVDAHSVYWADEGGYIKSIAK